MKNLEKLKKSELIRKIAELEFGNASLRAEVTVLRETLKKLKAINNI
jgi:hypothetical protein